MQRVRAISKIKLKSLAIVLYATLAAGLSAPSTQAKGTATLDLKACFTCLSTHGNSTCSQEFMESIALMPAGARLQGSCCSQMVWQRYIQQAQAIKRYTDMPEIPPDPHDIAAGLARRRMAAYDAKLTPAQQAAQRCGIPRRRARAAASAGAGAPMVGSRSC